ncbi:hypothetical protein acsn021_06640 [Anaerocolumna cellulosilytica]|uniref:Uncharacterized protein n=1 Tax=Anaerocolumna cellulosilytica TaxID=433286 RepID=A0A6S6R0G1_9FIRM|nr:hypothetical protein [Anaerocolumna cellulosilytica]MBB5197681.1 hypothetical protein [Anaerocolumna cellulosilytica]BCJ93095.1 hypothetical protein acsn021_06640 [Anaerocolumna cellulosilytica]
MKKKIYIYILVCTFVFRIISPAYISASTVYYDEYVTVSYVSDISGTSFPSTKTSYLWEGEHMVYKFQLSEPTIIKAYFSWSQSDEVPGGIAWFSKDMYGVDIIGNTAAISSKNKYNLILLEPGTYYINYSFGKRGSYKNAYNIGLSIAGQKVNTNTLVSASSWENPNVIRTDFYYEGFLSNLQPSAHYLFSVSSKSYVTIDYLFKQVDNLKADSAKCTLYYRNGRVIKSQKYDTRDTSKNKIAVLLEPGDYYINLSDATAPTSLYVIAEPRTNTLTQSIKRYTNKDVTVWLDSSYDHERALMVSSKVTDSNIRSNTVWKTSRNDTCLVIEEDFFTVSENGWYTVRTEDENENYVMTTINITNIDKVPPTTNIVNNKTYTSKSITIRFDDDVSGVKSAKLNGKVINYGKVVKAKGKYKLVITDQAGNAKTVVFTKK